MNLQNLRWPVVFVALAVALGLVFGSSLALKSRTVDQPLEALLDQADAVVSHQVTQVGDRWEITVGLKQTPDLKATYVSLDKGIQKVMKDRPYMLKVTDGRTPELEQGMSRVDLYVQEAMSTGQFATMADRVQAEAGTLGAQANVSVDARRVYVQVKQGDAYLYEVVDRPGPMQAHQEGGTGL